MGKPLLFYVIDEHTDYIKFCKNKGMKPYKFKDKTCYCSDPAVGNQIIKSVIQYAYKGYIYDVLEYNQCYSGYMVTLMRLPKLSYEELLNTALTSKSFDERAGAMGVILKEYSIEFEEYLLSAKNGDAKILANKKNIRRMVIMVNDFIKESTSYVWPLEKILNLCKELKLQLN